MESDNKTAAIALVRDLLARPDADWDSTGKTETDGATCSGYRKVNCEGKPTTAF